MSGLNADELEIIKDILGTDDDDPIFGNQRNQADNNKNVYSTNSQNFNSKANIKGSSSCNSNHSFSVEPIEPPAHPLTPKYSSNNMFGSPKGPVQKCTSVCIGGPNIPVGMTTETSGPHVCSNLSCIKCDHNVLRFPDRRWKKTTDYLFLRNNFPENVQQNLVIAPGWCAYCCQCTFCEEQNLRKLHAFSSNWVCRGHR